MLTCARVFQDSSAGYWSVSKAGEVASLGQPVLDPQSSQENAPQMAINSGTPTPDAPHALPSPRAEAERYNVQAGDSLGAIAQEFGVSMQQLIEENGITNPDHLEVGALLTIPVPDPQEPGPGFKIIPDSGFVYGPGSDDFDISEFVQRQGGYLSAYYEEIDDVSRSGAQVVQRVAQDYSIDPRLLLAVLEYQSGWVTQMNPQLTPLEYPLNLRDPYREGLYYQLAWAANALNRGYYVWRVTEAGAWVLADGSVVPISPVINAGTAGVQNFFTSLEGRPDWETAVGEHGVFATYNTLFGYPFAQTIEPLVPEDLVQPFLQLPFEKGRLWSFTGGPHGSWGSGSAWGALDFAPPSDALGCVQSEEWVTAMADGVIVRTGTGSVIQDLNDPGGLPADGREGTGWSLLYMHVESRDRIQPGSVVRAGDRIGHPSCEGGVSTGTHVHVARKYNGEWITADQGLPFTLDGWASSGDGYEYNGWLSQDGASIEAYAGRSEINGIQR